MKRLIAYGLRRAAVLLDGQDWEKRYNDFREFHHMQMRATNKYVGTAERYIVALEKALGKKAADAIRKGHPGRFDTSRLVDAGAWSQYLN